MKNNYYFDMDGVLVRYDRNAYVGENPRYIRKNEHYFRNLEPDGKALELIDSIYKNSRYTGDSIYILTSIQLKNDLFNEHFHDKLVWLQKWLPYIDIDHILVSVTTKHDAAEYINNHTLTESDILIDDFNKNLEDWKNAGGTSIKYCNGINSPETFHGPKIYDDDILSDKLLSIKHMLNNINDKEN